VSLTTPAVGLARLPGAMTYLLEEAAATAESAARLLVDLARDPHREEVLAAIGGCERAGDRITHDLLRELQERLALGAGRADLLRLTEALDDVLDAIDASAHAVAAFAAALPDDHTGVLVAILRDLTRTSTQAVRGIEEPGGAGEALHERAHALRDEFRRELRRATAAVLGAEADPIDATRAMTLLARLRALGDANARLGLAVEGVATGLS
jgi:Protein of unknown function DUF47